MKVKCDACPQLVIADLNVRFEKGIAEMTDPKKIAALRKMQGFDFAFEKGEKDVKE